MFMPVGRFSPPFYYSVTNHLQYNVNLLLVICMVLPASVGMCGAESQCLCESSTKPLFGSVVLPTSAGVCNVGRQCFSVGCYQPVLVCAMPSASVAVCVCVWCCQLGLSCLMSGGASQCH